MFFQFGGHMQVKQLRKYLEPMRLILTEQPLLGGTTPNFADLAAAGYFAVCASTSTPKLDTVSARIFTWMGLFFTPADLVLVIPWAQYKYMLVPK